MGRHRRMYLSTVTQVGAYRQLTHCLITSGIEMRRTNYQYKQKNIDNATAMAGFSMIELMIAMIISAVILTIAMPSFRSYIQIHQANKEIRNLRNDLQFARSEAQKEGQTVTACVSADGITCTTGQDWQSGWILFSDPNNNQQIDSSTDVLLRIQTGLSSRNVITTTPGVKAITYNRNGFALNTKPGGLLFTLHTSPVNNSATRCLLVDAMGRQQIQIAGEAVIMNQRAACA